MTDEARVTLVAVPDDDRVIELSPDLAMVADRRRSDAISLYQRAAADVDWSDEISEGRDDRPGADQYRAGRRLEHDLRTDLGAILDEYLVGAHRLGGMSGELRQGLRSDRNVLGQLPDKPADEVPDLVDP